MANPLEASIDSEMAQAPAPQAHSTVAQSIDQEMNQAKYGTFGQQLLTGAEGFAKGLAGPLATGAERALSESGFPGISPEDQAGRESANPIIHGASEVAGFAGPAILSGGTSAAVRAGLEVPEALRVLGKAAGAIEAGSQAGLLNKAGEAVVPVAEAMGIGGKGAGVLSKIGSSAVRGAAENAIYQTGDEVSRYINDPNSVESAIPHIGLSALIGGGFGAAGGGVSALWRSTMGSKTGALLGAIADKVGGIEGEEANPVAEMIAKTGMNIPPEMRAAASNDPILREMASVLRQTDTDNAGREFQMTEKDLYKQSGDALAASLGAEPSEIPDDYDKSLHGQNIGKVLAEEAAERVAPLKSQYEEYANKFSNKEFEPSISEQMLNLTKSVDEATNELNGARKSLADAEWLGKPEPIAEARAAVESATAKREAAELAFKNPTPGTVDMLQEKIGKFAQEEKVHLAPSDEIAKAVQSIQSELPQLKTLSDLTAYIKKAADKLPFDPLNPSRNAAARKLVGILRDTESDLIGHHIGSEEGLDSLEKYRATQKAYSEESKIKDALSDRLGKLGPTASYSKRIAEMAQTEPEKIVSRLSGKNDANILDVLSEHFPKTAEAVRLSKVEEILSKAKEDEGLNPSKIIKQLRGMSPELQHFTVQKGWGHRVDAIDSFLGQLKDKKQNFSNTGRTIDKLFQYIPSSAVGMISMLMGHNPAISFVLGALTKYLSKDAPDAVRLGLLKWMGSTKPIEAGAFKSMVDMIHATMKGESLADRSIRSLFNGATKVIPEHLMTSDRDIKDLDNKIKKVQMSPQQIQKSNELPGYYLPNHGISSTGTATRAINYLNQIRPATVKPAPLDPPIEPSEKQKSDFRSALEIAHQPLTVLQSIQDGQLISQQVDHLKSMYPNLYSRLSQKVMDQLTSHVSAEKEIPYNMRVGLSTFLGQPLDSSLKPQQIMSNQSAFASAPQQNEPVAKGGQKMSVVGMRNVKMSNRLSLSRQDAES